MLFLKVEPLPTQKAPLLLSPFGLLMIHASRFPAHVSRLTTHDSL